MQKIALVTGCSSGIGKSTALKFAREGIHTYASMRDQSKGSDLAEIAKKEDLSLEIIKLDVRRLETIDAAFEKIISDKDRLDVLVNNAGIMVLGSFEDVSMKDFNTQWETDFLGPVQLMKKAIPIMRNQATDEQGVRGNIINVSSIAGRIPFAYCSAYISSKFALEGLSECISDEVSGMGIKIRIIEPGVVKTKFFENTKVVSEETSSYSKFVKQWTRVAQELFHLTKNYPEDVAEVIFRCMQDRSWDLRFPVGEDAKLFFEMHEASWKDPHVFKKWFTDEMEKIFKVLK